MRRSRQWLAVIALLGAVTAAYADGPGGYRPKDPGPLPVSEQGAIDAYTAGYASILRAEHAENLAAASIERSRAQGCVGAMRRRRIRRRCRTSPAAVRLDQLDARSLHVHGLRESQARTLRRSAARVRAGAEDQSRTRPYAIEYQGEAFLGLNRIDEARFNFLRLYALDQTPGSEAAAGDARVDGRRTKRNRQRASTCQRWRRGSRKSRDL